MEETRLAYEIELKVKRGTGFRKERLDTPMNVRGFACKLYGDEIVLRESAYILMLNSDCRLLGYGLLSQGCINCTGVDVRMLCKLCVDVMATRAVFVHNHPSGSLKPSALDDNVTNQIRKALEIFKIRLDDSIIVTEDDYYSYQESGKL